MNHCVYQEAHKLYHLIVMINTARFGKNTRQCQTVELLSLKKVRA